MILSRANLIAAEVGKLDKGAVVHVREDGSTGVSGRRVVVVVGPVPDTVRGQVGRFLGDGSEGGNGGIGAYTVETVGEVLKNVPKDRTFGGLLEHVAVDDDGEWAVTDGKRKRTIKSARRTGVDPFGSIFGEIGKGRIVARCTVNRKRLLALLGAMDKALTDGEGGSSPAWIDFFEDGTIVARGADARTGQRMMGAVVSTIGNEAQLPMGEFEMELYGYIIEKKCPKCNNHMRRFADGREECSYVECGGGPGRSGEKNSGKTEGANRAVVRKGPPPRKKGPPPRRK